MKLEVTQVNSTQNQGKSEILKPVFLPGVYRPAIPCDLDDNGNPLKTALQIKRLLMVTISPK
jgi:hypothetical protein